MNLLELTVPSSPLAEYELIERIGSGTYGDVYKARHNDSGSVRALKSIKLEPTDDIKVVQQEILLMEQCEHRNIVAFYSSYKSRDRLWIAMELCEAGSIQDIYHESGPFTEEQIAFVLRETLRGLEYLHKNGKVHRDIKGANILLTNDGEIKLADFGVAASLTATMDKRKSFIGTPYWMAPEVAAVEKKGGYNHLCDIWAVGITAIECAELQPPMFDIHPMRVLYLMTKSNFKAPTLREKHKWSSTFENFIKYALTVNPKRRPDASRILEHPFLQGNLTRRIMRDLLNRLKISPEKFRRSTDDEEEKNCAPSKIFSSNTEENSQNEIERLKKFGFSNDEIQILNSKSGLSGLNGLTFDEIRHIIDVMKNGDLDEEQNFDGSTLKNEPNPKSVSPPIPSVPEVLMGAGLMKIFNKCPLQIHKTFSWTENSGRNHFILIGSEQGIYALNLNELHEATLEQLFPSRTVWIYIKDDILWSISGKSNSLYRHDLIALIESKTRERSTLIPKLEIFRLRKPVISSKVNELRGCIRCCVAENPKNKSTYLACLIQQEVQLFQYYEPHRKFMKYKTVPVLNLMEINFFQLIFSNETSSALLCSAVQRRSSCEALKFVTINFDNEEMENLPAKENLLVDVREIRQDEKDLDLIFVCRKNRIEIVTLKGKIRQNRDIVSEIIFTVEIEDFVVLRGSLLIFHKFGVEGRNLKTNAVTQEIAEKTRNFRLIGNKNLIVLETRSESSKNVDLHLLMGAENF